MSKLNIFRRDVPIGTYVTLYRTNGNDISGRVTDLDNVYVRIHSQGSSVTVFEDFLAGWKIHGGNTRVAATISNTSPQPSDKRSKVSDLPVGPASATQSEATQRLTKIKAEFSVTVERARLVFPEPDFQFPSEEFSSHLVKDVRRRWDQVRNKYHYAQKINEPNRINDIVVQNLEPLKVSHPRSPAIRALLGCMLLKLKQRRLDAIDHLAAAAQLSNAPSRWLALAAAAQHDSALQCYALRSHFSLISPVREMDSWYRYIGAAIEQNDLSMAGQLIRKWHKQPSTDPEVRCLLTESVIFVLSRLETDGVAMDVAPVLPKDPERLPPSWEDQFSKSASPSSALVAVERQFDRDQVEAELSAAQEHAPETTNGTPTGRIAFFGDQRFGFISTPSDSQFYFRISDVADQELRDALLDGTWRQFGPVEFEIHSSRGHQYDRAKNVLPFQDQESLLRRAQHFLSDGQFSQAMGLIRRVLAADSCNKTAIRLEREVKDRIRKGLTYGIGLPKGHGAYARAKRAQLVDLDLVKAEELFKRAIEQNDRKESAVKDLASLFSQQGRVDEAIVLLEDSSKLTTAASSQYGNMLATLYWDSQRYDDAIAELEQLYKEAAQSKKASLLARIAYGHLRCSRFDEAEQQLEKLLSIAPHDRNAQRLIAALDDVRQAEGRVDTEEIIGNLGSLVDEGMELSSLARAAIKRCTFQGVDPAVVSSGAAYSKDTINIVVNFAKELGTKRPRDRAAYYLSAAALLSKAPEIQSGKIYNYLRRHFTSMADASWIDKKPADVVRSYYIESLALVDSDELDEAWRTLLRYIATFSPDLQENIQARLPRAMRRGSTIPRQEYISALREILLMVKPDEEDEQREGLITVGSQSRFAKEALSEALTGSRDLELMFGKILGDSRQGTRSLESVWDQQCRDYARRTRRRLSVCRALTKCRATVTSMESLLAELRSAVAETNIRVDQRRLNWLAEIAESAVDYCRVADYEDRERNYRLVQTRADEFRTEVTDLPTQYSHKGLLPVADYVSLLIEEDFAHISRTSSPELGLKLVVDQYARGQHGELRLQIEVSNKSGCSPASSIRLRLSPADSEYFRAELLEREAVATLRGGTTQTVHMVIYPNDLALQDRAFPISAIGIYKNNLGQEERTGRQAWTVRLYPDNAFQPLENPYTPFAEGGPVDEPRMFVGRDDLLKQLETSLLSRSGSKSIVMFGQKRAGKSSLIEHLRRRLVSRQNIIPISFSLQEIAPELTVLSLFHRILQGVREVLDDLRLDGREVPHFAPPGIEKLMVHPTLQFHQAMSAVVRTIRNHSSGLRLVLLVDEFTDIFKGIQRERIPRDFMKAWKAIIEKKYFSSLLVGQDIMPRFKNEFPNEFGVTEDLRITYLDDTAAVKLVQGPIGKDRFAGRAVRRLLDLTANSPYYTMMFCARLVDYMNITRSLIVTEADILAVKEKMLHGERRLTKDKFDNLLTAGDGIEDSGIDPDDTYTVCAAIARVCRNREGWCGRESVIGEIDDPSLGKLLSDLETRDVVERKGESYRLRVGLFRDWLLIQG